MKTKTQFTNRILSLVLALMIVVGLVPMNVFTASAADGTACASTSGCTGTYDNGFCTVCDGYQVPSQNANGYYEISNAGNLYWFTYKVETNLKANAILTADIDLNPGYVFASDGTVTKDGVAVTEGWRYWEPIGVSDYEAGYQGIFDGNFHTVRGMYCIAEGGSSDSFLGFFSRVTGGTVTELGVTNGYVFGLADLGGIVGCVDSGTISKCWSEVTVMSSSDRAGNSFGGIAGSNMGVIENCCNLGLVSGRGMCLGGIVGKQNTVQSGTKVENCYNMGKVVPKGTETNYGDVVAEGGERVFNCYYLSESETDGLSGTTAATTTDFSSGKIAYLLNQGITNGSQAWYQTCGQGKPTFTGKTVYAISNSCYIGDGISGYTNQATVAPVHNYNSNGFCKNMRADGITVCDDYQPCEKDANGTYEIGNAGQLYWFARQVNEKEELSANAVLTADITINADINAADRRNWTPIGNYALTGKKYSGAFDGKGYKIRGLYCNRGSSSCAGLFGYCDGVVLKNINVKDSYFYADQLAAAIAGDVVKSQIINCHSINNTIIISSYTAGGVLGGCTDSIVDRCSNTSKVTHLDNGVIDNGFRSGGIIGWADDVTITNCWNSGEISARRLAAGGIVGGKTNDLSVKNCYNVGTVTLIGDAVSSGAYSPILGMEYNQDAPGELNIVNCYYLEADYPEGQRREGTTEKSEDAFKSGEVAYKLGSAWGQSIGTDTYPVLDGKTVYYGYLSCADDAVMVYTNDSNATDTKPGHTPDENGYTIGTDTHIFTCSACDASINKAHTMDSTTGKCVCGLEMAEASATIGGVTTCYSALNEAFLAVVSATEEDSATVKLLTDVDLGSTSQTISSGVFTLDLNGKTITGSASKVLNITGGTVTIDDSANGGSIVSTYTSAFGVTVNISGGTVNVAGGTIYTSEASQLGEVVNVTSGNLTVSGGNIIGGFSGTGVFALGGSVTITGGGISGIDGVYSQNSTLTVTGGNISGIFALHISGGNTTITGGTITGSHYDIQVADNDSITLTLADGKTLGAAFPGDITISDTTLNEILDNGMAYWQGGKMIVPSEDQTQITGGDVIIKAACNHSGSQHTSATDNHDGAHIYDCTLCGITVVEEHSFENDAHKCVCGKMETFTVSWFLSGSLMQSTSTYGQEFTQTFTVPEYTHLRIDSVYLANDASVPVNYTYENGVLTIAAEDVPAADVYIDCDHNVLVTFHANGGEIIPEDGYPQEGSTDIFPEDRSYWTQEWNYGSEICLLRCAEVHRKGYTFVDWRDASGQVHQVIPGYGNYTLATEDITLYAQWQCNHTIGGVVFRDNGNGTHNGYCGECDELLGNYVERPHDFGDNTHKCICGKKITPEVTAPTAKENLVYDGASKELINAGSTTGGTLQYSLDNVTWSAEIPTAITVGTHAVYYKVVGDENYEDVAAQSISATIVDKTAPTGTILIKENSWNKFWNTITFGIFCKDYVDVTVTADGTGSGVAKAEYLLSDTALDENNIPTEGWTEISNNNSKYSFSIQPQNKVAVYVRITDEGGNVTIINSDGIVVYEDSKAVDTEVTYTYKENSNKDISVEFNGNTVKSIVCGEKALAANSDYTVDYESGKIVLTASYLDTMDAGNYTFTVSYNPMGVEDSGVTDLTTTFTLVIDKADGEVSNINISGKTYDGTAVTASTYDKLGNGVVTVEYKVKGADDSTYTTTAPKNAGDYVVRVTAAEGTNHKAASATAEFSITPASIENAGVTLDSKTVVYNGSEHKPAVTVTWNGITLTENTDYVVYYRNNVNASDATVLGIVYVVGTNNFEGSIEKEFEITSREITITVDAKETIVNTTLPTYTYKVEGLVGVDTLVTEPTLTCNANIAVIGEYDITAIGADAGGNYSIKYVPAKLTVLTDNAVDAAAGYTEELKDYDPKAVTSEDKAELDEMLSEINTILADETTTDNGKKALEEVKEQVEKLIKEITDAAEATDTENTEKVENVTPENVTPENKTDLEGAKADLEKALEDNGGNYTEDEKKAIEDELGRIDEALEVIGNVETVKERISKLPAVDTVKPDDEEAIKAITDAQTAYNALSDYEKSLVDEAAKANLDKLVAALVAYDIVEGDGSSWTEDSDHNITFVVNGLFGKFVGIKVDGKDVDKANYEVKAGSTIITLKASYLDTLAVGEHTITVVYTDGSTDGAFNVHAKANSPATGDNSNMFLWIALLFISGGAVITLTVVDRKRRMASKR